MIELLTYLAAFAVGAVVGFFVKPVFQEPSKKEWVRVKSDSSRGHVVERHAEGFVVYFPETRHTCEQEKFYRWNQAFLEFADDWLHEEAKARIEAAKETKE